MITVAVDTLQNARNFKDADSDPKTTASQVSMRRSMSWKLA